LPRPRRTYRSSLLANAVLLNSTQEGVSRSSRWGDAHQDSAARRRPRDSRARDRIPGRRL